MPKEGDGEKSVDSEAEPDSAVDNKTASAGDSAELKERMLRLAAEFDNYKKRTAKDMDGAAERGKAEVLSRLLPVIDEFELALSSMDMKQESVKGISLIYSNLISTLKALGLKTIDAKGRYDPYKHEIMLTEESSEEDGTILGVIRKGYLLNGIMLRPASVVVSKQKPKAESNDVYRE